MKALRALFVIVSMCSTSASFAGTEQYDFKADSVELLNVVTHCPTEFAQLVKTSDRIGGIRLEDDNTYKIAGESGGFLGGPVRHMTSLLTITKTQEKDPVFVPSKPTTFTYNCKFNLVMSAN